MKSNSYANIVLNLFRVLFALNIARDELVSRQWEVYRYCKRQIQLNDTSS